MTFGTAGSAGRFQVFAHVQSTAKHWGVTFKVDVDDTDPAVASWVPMYAGADWHERECWEMYGVRFDGHSQQGDEHQCEHGLGNPPIAVARHQPLERRLHHQEHEREVRHR